MLLCVIYYVFQTKKTLVIYVHYLNTYQCSHVVYIICCPVLAMVVYVVILAISGRKNM